MIDTAELKKLYMTLSTKELLEIVDNPSNYTPLAVSVAEAELTTRQNLKEEIQVYAEEKLHKAMTVAERNIVDDLSFLEKNLFYFIWVPLFHFPFKQNFRDGRYMLKLRQANYYSVIGCLALLLTGWIAARYHFSTAGTLLCWMSGFVPAFLLDETINRDSQIRRLKDMYEPEEEKTISEDEEVK